MKANELKSENIDKVYAEIENRDRIIIKTGFIGVVANIFLAAFKAVIGLLSNSIAIILDAVNNFSDALSSIITIIGMKFANKRPDRKHPLGHGRAEYISAMLVSAIILYAGITSMVESIKKIINPLKPDYSIISLTILAAAVLVKIVLGKYVKNKGKKVNSGALIASGADAMFDAVLSLSVLISAIIFIFTQISLEAYVGALISAFIIKAGIEMMLETLDDILGKRADAEITKKIKEILEAEPEVRGAYDLVLNNYGTGKNYASVHLELPDIMTVEDVDILTRRLQSKVLKQTGTILVGVGVYSFNTKNGEESKIRNHIMDLVMSHEWALQLHGFYADIEAKEIRFDVVMSFDIDYDEGINILKSDIEPLYPDYSVYISPDIDISD
ncbi:MAG: cation diffusion facilitator family transporter [Anaerovoracaceae bacterium]